jgi:hypothetical protein
MYKSSENTLENDLSYTLWLVPFARCRQELAGIHPSCPFEWIGDPALRKVALLI